MRESPGPRGSRCALSGLQPAVTIGHRSATRSLSQAGPVNMPHEYPVCLVRPPIVSTRRAFNNEATPCIGLAYIGSYLTSKGYEVSIVDGIGEALSHFWDTADHPG